MDHKHKTKLIQLRNKRFQMLNQLAQDHQRQTDRNIEFNTPPEADRPPPSESGDVPGYSLRMQAHKNALSKSKAMALDRYREHAKNSGGGSARSR